MQQDLKNTPTEELLKKEKTLKTLTGILTGFAVVYLLIALYFLLKGGKNTTTLFICLLPIVILLPMQYKNLKSLREEINRR